MLEGLEKAGEGKAGIVPAVISTMSHNRPSKPVILTRTESDATKALIERAKCTDSRNFAAPIFRFVDMAKDLHRHIPRRPGGHKNTWMWPS